MDWEDVIDELKSLVKLDYDAIKSYDEAIKRMDEPDIRTQLIHFRADHERHINDLSNLVTQQGGTPPERSPDMTGRFLQIMTTVQSAMGTSAALRAMETAEKHTTKEYREAAAKDFPLEVRRQIEANYQDEQRHLAYIQQAQKVRA